MNKKLIYIIIAVVILNLTFVSAIYISVNVPEKYERVKAGEKLFFNFEIKDSENVGRQDIFLEYEIRKGDKLIAAKTETKAIETQASFLESISIPKDTQSGIYSIVVTVNKDLGSAIFFVEKQINYFLIIIVIIIIGFFLTLLKLYRIRKSVKK